MDKEILVTIIIPVYNGANYVSNAIKSAVSQTYKNLEILVVNDGSTDNGETEKEIKKFDDKRIKYFKKENGGVASALNFAIKLAKGDYICWLSHDDCIGLNKIEKQLYFLKKNKCDSKTILYTKTVLINHVGKKCNFIKQLFYKCPKTSFQEVHSYFDLNHIYYCSLLIPSNFLKNNLFEEDLRYSQDVFSYFQMLISGYKLKYSPGCLTYSRVHPNQGSVLRISEFDNDSEHIYNEFTSYFKKTRDTHFLNKYLLYLASKATRFNICHILYKKLLEDYKEYFERKIKQRAYRKLKFYKLLYSIKIKLFGR